MYVKTNRMHGCCETVVHLTFKQQLWHFLAKKKMRAWIFVRKSVPLRLVIVGMGVLIC